jgi:ATP-dependent Clp protease adaptor protein ClpS
MELVVQALEQVLALPHEQATKLMLEVHNSGSAVVARLPADEAVERAQEIFTMADEAAAPLRVTLEPV